jgi:DNA (cytosine-5)-methyltransferase 1
MALYGIFDIKMRMLLIDELKQIMGFDKGYRLIGTKTEKKKYIGNAVEVNMSRVMCEALIIKLYETGIFKISA